MADGEYIGAFTLLPVHDDETDFVDTTDGFALATGPGGSYGATSRYALLITADAAGAFNLKLRGMLNGVGAYKSIGFSDGDVNSGQAFECAAAHEWVLESGSLGLFSHVGALLDITSGTPNVTISFARIGKR